MIQLQVVTSISITLSSVLYSWAWLKPAHFKRSTNAEKDPSGRLAQIAVVLRAVQFILCFLCWDLEELKTIPTSHLMLAAILLLFGQHLNYLVYKYLGTDGVYYGTRFGKTLPWVHAYPYSHFKDPQYLGCIATAIGLGFLHFPTSVVTVIVLNYIYLMCLEH
eukprot:TRINITY_DN6595_c0_g1::TRINITY_DN6595_c0_g1_i1::g.13483::m.13483 TRINITY_DN6595_c0_g1::TRINITY_DN6595_c0_g1_i1::g.13483  ORF type:complete len:163 (-),score=13.56,sp/Q9SAH5/PLMT_ARATH/32.08/7e-22,PEMT/PF04191.8/1.1e+04,PEMT/PF04191.8/1.2e+04,PEMT/PF04191.8/1.5e-09,ICMT/PF04140.9/0.00077 TRINITY_DN6595_c0_g1_i1:154-642(-)